MCIRDSREESEQTKTEMNKKWEETNYKIDQLNETLDNWFQKLNVTLDSRLDSRGNALRCVCLLYTSGHAFSGCFLFYNTII